MRQHNRTTVWAAVLGTLLGVVVANAQTTVTGPGPMSVGTTNATSLILQANSTSYVWLTSGGNLGIGTSTPADKLHVVGNTTLGGNLLVTGNTTLGGAATNTVTIVAGTVTAANLPTGTTDNFIISDGGQLKVRTISNIVTGTGTTNRLVRWTSSSTIGDGSLDDNGNGTLSRSGNIAINPGAGNTLSTNGNLSVGGTGTFGGALTVSSGGASITGNVSVTGNITATGNVSVGGNTTLGGAATNTVTIVAGTVTAANLPTGATTDDVLLITAAPGNQVKRIGSGALIGGYAWLLTGNGGTNPAVNFLGTTDAQPLVIRTNNVERLRVTATGNVGIGTAAPAALLHVAGTGRFDGQLVVTTGGASITGNVSVTGDITATGNVSVGGNTTLGGAATNTVTIVAGTVTAANLPTGSTSNDFVVRESSGQLKVKTLTGIVTGSGTPTQVAFWTGSNSLGGSNNLWWDNTNNRLGIGTSSPAQALHVVGNAQVSGNITAGGNINGANVNASGNMNAGGNLSVTGNGSIGGNLSLSGHFSVGGNAGTAGQVLVSQGAGNAPQWWDIVDDGTTTTVTVGGGQIEIAANNVLPIWNANQLQGYDVSSNPPSPGNILVWNGTEWEPNPVTVAGAWSVNGNPGTDPALNFLGTTDDQPLIIKTNGVERMRVANSTYNGYVGIGDTDPAYRLELPNLANPGGRGRANSWLTYSSMRWKEEIRPLENALDKVMRLRGYHFRWKPEYGGTEDIGFLAEEVAQVVPEVVSYEPDGQVGGMDYSRLVALLVEAIKQQQQEIDQLRGMVEQLLRERGERGGTGMGVEIHDAWLGQNIPNPFEGTTTIPYYVPAGVSRAELVVRDLGGRELRRVELPERGAHGQVVLEMRLLGSGTYEYSLVLDGRVVATKQMTLVR